MKGMSRNRASGALKLSYKKIAIICHLKLVVSQQLNGFFYYCYLSEVGIFQVLYYML